MAEPAKNAGQKYDMSNPISLGPHVEIFPNAPLPLYNGPGGPAFAARARNEAQAEFFAIVCSSAMPVRSNYANAFRAMDNPGILRLRENGVVPWPSQNGYAYVLVYERPLTPQLFWQSLDEVHQPMNEDTLNRRFLTPVVHALSEFQRMSLVHGGIRPTNIFWHDGSTTAPQFGECLSAQAGMAQPALFESVERAMCAPAARGPGLTVDDSYALGVTVALLILGRNPLQNLSDAEILQLKLEKGSFNAFVNNHRLPASNIELLRGLLADDSRQRWTASDLDEWLSGRRLTPKNSEVGRRANRSFTFLGKDYWHVRPLAMALASNREEATRVIENNMLSKWIARSLDDQKRTHALDEAIESLKENNKTGNYQEQLVARTCMALDPPGPIRYRGLSVMPDGIATALAACIANNQPPQILTEIVATQLVTFWVNAQSEGKLELVPLAQQMERLKSTMERARLGSGVERALYELNPTLPCLSPMVKASYVVSMRDMLAALEKIATSPNKPTEPMDRHIAAFLLSHDRRGEHVFDQMSPPAPPQKRALALLALFSELQYRFGPEQVPGLCQWILGLLEPDVKRFFNRAMREKIRKQLKEVAGKGHLSRLESLIDDPSRLSKDESEFLMARLIYRNVEREIAEIKNKLGKSDELLVTMGRPMAASLASFIAILSIGVVGVRMLLQFLF